MAIHEYARGIPRTINVICDNALLGGFALGRQPVDRQIVLDVIRDFDLRRDEAGDRQTAEAADADTPVSEPAEGSPDSGSGETPPRPLFQTVRPRRFAFFGARS